jgi:hypothetical protein
MPSAVILPSSHKEKAEFWSPPTYADPLTFQAPPVSIVTVPLDTAATLLAKFSDGSNDPRFLPSTPFQVIYDNGSDVFNLKTGTRLFVPILYINDSPPVIGTYPSDKSGLAFYYFDPTQIGIEGAQIEVDGNVTDIGPDYIGAVFDVALPNGGSNCTELGAFLTPLAKGTHTITIRMAVRGEEFVNVYGSPITFELTYTVNVK